MATALNGATTLEAAAYDSLEGVEQLDKVVDIDQSPIGRTPPRSNPATYTGIFTPPFVSCLRVLPSRAPVVIALAASPLTSKAGAVKPAKAMA